MGWSPYVSMAPNHPNSGRKPAAVQYTPRPTVPVRRSGFSEIVSPWAEPQKASYTEASKPVPYQAQWQQGVQQAQTLGNRDYESDLRRFAGEDVEKQIKTADDYLGAIGMRELGLRQDVQQDRAKLRTDASTRAMIDSQGIKASALQTMQSTLASASSAELQRIAQMIAAASMGGAQYNEFQQLAIPLQNRLGGAA